MQETRHTKTLGHSGIPALHKHTGSPGSETSTTVPTLSSSLFNLSAHTQFHIEDIHKSPRRDKSRSMMQETARLFQQVLQINWTLKANSWEINNLPNQISRARQLILTVWSLDQQSADSIFQQWGCPLKELYDTPQLYVSHILVSGPRSQSPSSGCSFCGVPRPGGLCLSPSAATDKESPEVPARDLVQTYSDCTMVAKAAVVSNPQPTGGRTSPPPLQLPVSRTLLRQPGSNKFHPYKETLKLHTWLLEKWP